MSIHPAFAPISLRATFPHRGAQCSSSGQNLAALGTTAGKNLAAVCSSHSLAETMDLCAVTLSGLIGTQHLRVHLLLDYAQQPDSGRSNRKSSCAGMDAISKHGCAIDIISQHPVESQPEVLNFVRKFRAFL